MLQLGDGYFHCFRWRGVPVRMHWAVPVLGVFELLLGRSWVRLVGFAIIILVHELGHAVLVKRYRLQVHAIQIHPLGGECIHEATASARTNVIIAWGGVLAQMVLIAAALAVGMWLPVSSVFASELLHVFTVSNAFMAAFNLIPIRPLDGYTAWQLKHLRVRIAAKPEREREGRRRGKGRGKVKSVDEMQVEAIEALVDDALEQARKKAKDQERS